MASDAKVDYVMVGTGLALLSPLDEIIVGVASGGTSAPASPAQGVVSGIIGLALIAKGMGWLK